jgi:hypothetical protein
MFLSKAAPSQSANEPGKVFALLCACCRWPASGETIAEIREASADVDWGLFDQAVRRHRVDALVSNALGHADVSLPPELLSTLRARAFETARQNLALAAESYRLLTAFQFAGIPLLFIKGLTLAKLAYGSLSL